MTYLKTEIVLKSTAGMPLEIRECTLSDGSLVYDVIAGSTRICCEDYRHAKEVFDALEGATDILSV